MPRNRLKLGFLGWMEWLALVPRVVIDNDPEVSIRVQHDPLLAGPIHVQIHHFLRNVIKMQSFQMRSVLSRWQTGRQRSVFAGQNVRAANPPFPMAADECTYRRRNAGDASHLWPMVPDNVCRIRTSDGRIRTSPRTGWYCRVRSPAEVRDGPDLTRGGPILAYFAGSVLGFERQPYDRETVDRSPSGESL